MEDLIIEKAFIYRFLSLGFDYPSKESLKVLYESLGELSTCSEKLGIPLNVGGLKREIKNSLERITDIKGDYLKLFEGNPLVPIRETSYELDKSARRAMEMADLLGFYTAFGVQPREGIEPDHLSAELEFLSFLYQKLYHLKSSKNQEGCQITESAITEFLKNHIGRWYELFCNTLLQTHVNGFYTILANFLKLFLNNETRNLGNLKKLTRLVRERIEQGSSFGCGF